MKQIDGTCWNYGLVHEYTMTGGMLENDEGYIETLYYGGGRYSGRGNIGKIIYLDEANAGADSGSIDDAVLDDADFDDAGWQYPVPRGEEVMVW